MTLSNSNCSTDRLKSPDKRGARSQGDYQAPFLSRMWIKTEPKVSNWSLSRGSLPYPSPFVSFPGSVQQLAARRVSRVLEGVEEKSPRGASPAMSWETRLSLAGPGSMAKRRRGLNYFRFPANAPNVVASVPKRNLRDSRVG